MNTSFLSRVQAYLAEQCIFYVNIVITEPDKTAQVWVGGLRTIVYVSYDEGGRLRHREVS